MNSRITKRAMFLGATLLLIMAFASANAAMPVVAKVTDAGTNADGSVFVVFDRPVAVCEGKGLKRIDVTNEHAAKNQVLLIGMTALSTFASTKTFIDSCQNGVPVFTGGKSYFQITSEKAVPLNKQ